MFKYKYFVLPFLKWIANYAMVMVVFGMLLPPFYKWLDLLVGWTLSAVVAAPFAYWAFHNKNTSDKQLAMFIGSWAVITIFLESLSAFFAFLSPWSVLTRYEFLVQVLFEVAMILAMHRILRRQRAYHEAAEGIEIN